jgi:hypothetical protein
MTSYFTQKLLQNHLDNLPRKNMYPIANEHNNMFRLLARPRTPSRRPEQKEFED